MKTRFIFLIFFAAFASDVNAQFVEQLRSRTSGVLVTDPNSPKKKIKVIPYSGATGSVLTMGVSEPVWTTIPTGTDDQNLTLVGNTLTLEDGGTVDLTPYLDNTDDQAVTDFSLSGTILTLTLEDGGTQTVNLSGLSHDGTTGSIFFAGADGSPTEDNANFSWNSNLQRLIVKNKLYVEENIYGASKEAFRFTDSWLRINPSNAFANGVFLGDGITRLDGEFRVGAGGAKLVVKNTGNLGIGVTTPQQRLHLNGNILLENNNELRFKDDAGLQRTAMMYTSSNDLMFYNSGGGKKIMFNNTGITSFSGDVGIGTATPTEKLEVAGNIKVTKIVDETGSTGTANQVLSPTATGVLWGPLAGTDNQQISLAANTLTLEDGGTVDLSFLENYWTKTGTDISYSAGNVGIGIITPDEKLDVVGNIKLSQSILANPDQALMFKLAGSGKGGNIQSTANDGAVAGYGIYTAYNAHYDPTAVNWVKDRGKFWSYLNSANHHHHGWKWFAIPSSGTNGSTETDILQYEVLGLNSAGNLNLKGKMTSAQTASSDASNTLSTKAYVDNLVSSNSYWNHTATQDIILGGFKLKSPTSLIFNIDTDNDQLTSAYYFQKDNGQNIATLSESGEFHLLGNIKVNGVTDANIQTKYFRFENAANSTPTNAKSLYYNAGDLTLKDNSRGIRKVALYPNVGTNTFAKAFCRVQNAGGTYTYDLVIGERGIIQNTGTSNIVVSLPSGISFDDQLTPSNSITLAGHQLVEFVKIDATTYVVVNKY